MTDDGDKRLVPPWIPIAAFAIGVLTLAFFMGLVAMSIIGKEVPCHSRFLIVVTLALCAALAFGLWGSTIAAKGKIPLPYFKHHPIAFAATGGIAALIVVLLLGNWLYSERDCILKKSDDDAELSYHINSMYTNLNQKSYDGALEKADDVLEIDPNNYRALNVKGTIAFYRRQFQDATKYFEQAYKAKSDPMIGRNLADSYVEIGAYELAIKTYLAVNTSTEEWHYAIGRAFVFAGKYDDALAHLQVVKININEHAGHVMMAATYVGKSLLESNLTEKEKLLGQAREEMKQACIKHATHWNQILVDGKTVEYETYDKIYHLLEVIYVDGKPCS